MKTETLKNLVKPIESTDLLADLDAEAKLMRAAQKFSLAFDENRVWGDPIKRLDYTLSTWRDLAMAAVAFSNSHSAERPSGSTAEKERGFHERLYRRLDPTSC
jgi:hypothetical protein